MQIPKARGRLICLPKHSYAALDHAGKPCYSAIKKATLNFRVIECGVRIMKKNRGATIGIGIFFGFVAYAITVFFVSPQLALVFGILSVTVYILVLSIVMDINFKKYENIDMVIDQDVILKDTANYYGENLIVNVILYLTADKLISFPLKKSLCIAKKYY